MILLRAQINKPRLEVFDGEKRYYNGFRDHADSTEIIYLSFIQF